MTTEDLTKQVRIPIWLIVLGTTIALALSGFLLKQSILQGQIMEQLSRLRHDLDTHIIMTRGTFDTKADKEDTYRALVRIETKLDKVLER